MLTLSIAWVVLAVTVTSFAIVRRTPAGIHEDADVRVPESGRALTLFAVIYGVALLAGFVFVSRFLVSSF